MPGPAIELSSGRPNRRPTGGRKIMKLKTNLKAGDFGTDTDMGGGTGTTGGG